MGLHFGKMVLTVLAAMCYANHVSELAGYREKEASQPESVATIAETITHRTQTENLEAQQAEQGVQNRVDDPIIEIIDEEQSPPRLAVRPQEQCGGSVMADGDIELGELVIGQGGWSPATQANSPEQFAV